VIFIDLKILQEDFEYDGSDADEEENDQQNRETPSQPGRYKLYLIN